MKRERIDSDPRFETIKNILRDAFSPDFKYDPQIVLDNVANNLSKLVDDDDKNSLLNYLDENPTIENILSADRPELGMDNRQNPKTIMSFMREIFENTKKQKSKNN